MLMSIIHNVIVHPWMPVADYLRVYGTKPWHAKVIRAIDWAHDNSFREL